MLTPRLQALCRLQVAVVAVHIRRGALRQDEVDDVLRVTVSQEDLLIRTDDVVGRRQRQVEVLVRAVAPAPKGMDTGHGWGKVGGNSGGEGEGDADDVRGGAVDGLEALGG